jgi:diacylglycerol kinase (ATP)
VDNSQQKVFIVLNPKAGNANQAEEIHVALEKHFPQPDWTAEVYETTGKEDEDVAALCRQACERGASLVVAAGGDGTVVDVANGLINTQVPLGVLPLGTGNDLARILSIPLKMEDAFAVLSGDHRVIEADALKVGDRFYLSNVSVGISPHVMKDTDSTQKKRFGLLAYVWTLIKRVNILQLQRYRLTIDGQLQLIHASEVLVSNTTLLERLPSVFGPPENLNDSQLEVYLITARSWGDYVRMAWNLLRRPGKSVPKLNHLGVKRSIRIEAIGTSRLVQADGEVIGRTPVEVELVHRAIRVIMAKPNQDTTAKEMDVPAVQEYVG